MSSAHKKVIVRRFTGDTLPGYLLLSTFVRNRAPQNTIDLLDLSGRVTTLLLNDIKHISYVRDFNLSDTANPERLTRRTFLARPRTEGLWLRMTFRDGETLEGLAPLDISFLDSVATDRGLSVTPPDTRSNTQRVFVPRSALTALDLLGLIASAANRKPAAKPAREPEPWLFDNT
jgi:hypothetical protein